MQAHAEQCFPQECCGLLGGDANLFVEYYPLTNHAEDPTKRFFAAPAELFAVMQQMRQRGQQQLGIYHSHPSSRAYPSATDIELAFYPEAIYFILSLQSAPELCAFRCQQGEVSTIEFAIVD